MVRHRLHLRSYLDNELISYREPGKGNDYATIPYSAMTWHCPFNTQDMHA
jgi:hypothetical protein